MAHFSGHLAADELYDGPFAVLSLVDNRRFRRLGYLVLEQAPTEADVQGFFAEFQRALDQRGLEVRGITTDGSALYPGPIAQVFGPIPHQIYRLFDRRCRSITALLKLADLRQAKDGNHCDHPGGGNLSSGSTRTDLGRMKGAKQNLPW